MRVDTVIRTKRLDLWTMSPEFLRASLEGNRERAGDHLGLDLPEDWPRERDILKMRLEDLRENPGWEPWLTRVIGLRSERKAIGIGGFHGPPGGDSLREFARGGVEFGYTVYREWRRQGFALEACEALMSWAIQEAGVDTFVLSINAANRASVSLAGKLGFSKVGTRNHEVRGAEDVYRRCALPDRNGAA